MSKYTAISYMTKNVEYALLIDQQNENDKIQHTITSSGLLSKPSHTMVKY